MKKKQALAKFTDFKTTFETKDFKNRNSFLLDVKSYTKNIFGDDSFEFQAIKDFNFDILTNNFETAEDVNQKIKHRDNELIAIIDNCISKINDGFIKQKEYPNFLGSTSTVGVIGIGFSLLMIGFSIGYWVSQTEILKSNHDSYNLEQIDNKQQ